MCKWSLTAIIHLELLYDKAEYGIREIHCCNTENFNRACYLDRPFIYYLPLSLNAQV